MEFLLDQYNSYRAQYNSAFKLYSFARTYGSPVVGKTLNIAQKGLFEHPDLTSVALLLVILYISFVFLVKAWRLTIGTVMFAFKAGCLMLIASCLFGAYSGVVNGDMSVLHALFLAAQTMLRLVGDSVLGGNTSKEPSHKLKL